MNPETPATSEPESKSSSSSKTAMLMMQVLAPAVEEIDSRVLAVFESQKQLNKELERLGAELQMFMETSWAIDAKDEQDLDQLIQRVLQSRQRVLDVNRLLLSSQQRLDRIYSMVKQ